MQQSKECMCCLQNIAMRDYKKSVTIEQTDGQTDKLRTKWSLWTAMLRRWHKMHVLPAKHSYAWLPRKCDYWTDRQMDWQTDAGQSDPYVPLCFAGDTKMTKSKKRFKTHNNYFLIFTKITNLNIKCIHVDHSYICSSSEEEDFQRWYTSGTYVALPHIYPWENWPERNKLDGGPWVFSSGQVL